MPISSLNPATQEVLKTFDALNQDQLEEKLARARDTFANYLRTTFSERAAMMQRAAEVLERDKKDFARLMTQEMGKPIIAAVQEAEKCAWVCRYYAENAEKHLADENVQTTATRSFVSYQPLGVVLAVMPWNFPFWQVFRFAAPALMAGNAGILKHASNVPRCALQIEEIFRAAGFPQGLFGTILVRGGAVAPLIADPRIVAVTLTGSEAAGIQIAERAGHDLKKTVLELGGSDPFIVMPSADLKTAAKVAADARLINSGQSCIAAKRFIVVEPVRQHFVAMFA